MCQSGQPFGFPKDNIQVLSLHFRRNGSIEDGFDITFDGSQRGTEVVGYIGNQFPLVFIIIPKGSRHKIHGVCQIAKLVIPFQRDGCLEISNGIISGSFPESAKRVIDDQPVGSDK